MRHLRVVQGTEIPLRVNPVYRVRDWGTHFENHKSRVVERRDYQSGPNKQDGGGLTRVLREKDGLAIYGVFWLIIGILSRQPRPRDGWLTENGRPDGIPMTAADIAYRLRRAEKEIQRALDFTASDELEWLERVGPNDPRREAASMAPSSTTGEGRPEDASTTPRRPVEDATDRIGTDSVGTSEPANPRELGNPNPYLETAKRVLAHLNDARDLVPRGYTQTEGNLDTITARLREGHSEQDLVSVLDMKAAEARRDKAKAQWFNPHTPFRKTLFETNLNRAVAAKASRPVVSMSEDTLRRLREIEERDSNRAPGLAR